MIDILKLQSNYLTHEHVEIIKISDFIIGKLTSLFDRF